MFGDLDWTLNMSCGLSATAEFLLTNKKALGEMKTLRASRSNAEPKNFAKPQAPFPGVQDHQNLISWRRSLPAPTDPVWWRSMHAILSYRGNRHRPPTTNTQTHRQDWLQYTALLASMQCNNWDDNWSVACINWVSRKKWIWENRHWSCGHETAKIQLNSGLTKYILYGSA